MALLRTKGWTVRDAAQYLGVSRQRLYSVFSERAPARLWSCAIDGLPVCTDEIRQALKDERANRPKRLPASKPPALVLEVGDGVTANTYVGIAEEGEQGWIEALRGEGPDLQIFVKMDEGEDWFPLEDFKELFVQNGRTKRPGI